MSDADAAGSPFIVDDETVTTSRHSITFGRRRLEYRADAATLTVRADDDRPLATMFSLAYVADHEEGTPRRPLTFLFNGGPGSGSLWLNIGGFGPKRVPTSTPLATPPPPYAAGDNPYSLLEHSDLVFLDAPGTGYSRVFPGVDHAEVWGVDQDVDVFARAIIRYITLTDSWNAPRFLFGESYGTTRGAALVNVLQERGLDFNGVVLLSAVLDWAQNNLGLDQAAINLLPTLAATARYHGRAPGGAQDLDTFLDEARRFSRTTYAEALQLGDLIRPEREREVAAELSAYIGIPVDDLLQQHLRFDMEGYRRALLRDEGRLIGRFDTRFASVHHYVQGSGAADPATDDAATAAVSSALISAFRDHVGSDLGYRSPLHYRHLNNMEIAGAWDWRHRAPGSGGMPAPVPNVALDLSAAMRRNAALKVFVMGGIYDLATPFAGAEYDVSHLYLDAALRANVRFGFYESGHMTFVDERIVGEMKRDLTEFYADALHD